MKNNVTELVFIIDKSGSMAGLEDDTVGGFNAMLKKQKKLGEPCYVSTILFNGESEVIHDREKICEIDLMTEKDYTVGGCTALIDALGGAIHHVSKLHKYFGENAPARTMFVITTDGMENASRRYTSEQVKNMIEHQKEKFGWEFLFIGANIDAVQTAARYGIDEERAVNYNADGQGTKILYQTVSDAVCSVRANAPLSADWKTEIDKDFKKRSKR